MNILSLFDGISCGQLALNKANVKYDKYFSSEIDEKAISITQKNYLDTIQIGDVTKIDISSLPKIDLLIGGSPCTGFSVAGKRLNFDDPKSKLFFDYVEVLNKVKPKYFLLENVKMKNAWVSIINDYLGVEAIEINSNLVSAQNRKRLYWTNIPNIDQPEDKGIYLKDILQENVLKDNPEYSLNDKYPELLEKYSDKRQVTFTERRTEEAKRIRREYRKKYGIDYSPRRAKEIVPRTDDKFNCLTTSLTKEHILMDETGNLRKPTPIECERLQTVPDNYTEGLTDNQRYFVLGNGWTVDVVSHILKNINLDN